MADVFPARNLPGLAEDWGRHIEKRVVEGENSDQQLSQKVDNGLRATAGQLAVLAGQIDELTARFSATANIPTLAVTGNATIEPFPRVTVNVVVPGPNVTRSARIDLQGLITESPATGANLWLEAESPDGLLWRSERFYTPIYTGAPQEWSIQGGSQFATSFNAIIPAGTTFTFTLRGVRTSFTSTPSTISLVNGLATVTYGAPV